MVIIRTNNVRYVECFYLILNGVLCIVINTFITLYCKIHIMKWNTLKLWWVKFILETLAGFWSQFLYMFIMFSINSGTAQIMFAFVCKFEWTGPASARLYTSVMLLRNCAYLAYEWVVRGSYWHPHATILFTQILW